MDDVRRMIGKDYMVYVGQYGTKVTYDVEAGLWRGLQANGQVNDIFIGVKVKDGGWVALKPKRLRPVKMRLLR